MSCVYMYIYYTLSKDTYVYVDALFNLAEADAFILGFFLRHLHKKRK